MAKFEEDEGYSSPCFTDQTPTRKINYINPWMNKACSCRIDPAAINKCFQVLFPFVSMFQQYLIYFLFSESLFVS